MIKLVNILKEIRVSSTKISLENLKIFLSGLEDQLMKKGISNDMMGKYNPDILQLNHIAEKYSCDTLNGWGFDTHMGYYCLDKLDQSQLNSLYKELLDFKRRWSLNEIRIINPQRISPEMILNLTREIATESNYKISDVVEYLLHTGLLDNFDALNTVGPYKKKLNQPQRNRIYRDLLRIKNGEKDVWYEEPE